MKDLKFLPHLSGVQQVHDGSFARAGDGCAGFVGKGGGDHISRMVNEETFLRGDKRGARGRGEWRERGDEPVPADVDGEVLFAGLCE